MKKLNACIFCIIILSLLFSFNSCDSNTVQTYPAWFNEYTGDNFTYLKAAQDAFDCFGNTISDNVIILRSDDSPPVFDINYTEDDTGKHFLITFTTRDKGALVDSTDIQPFRNALVASGYILDEDPASDTYSLYVKGSIIIGIYVINMDAGDAHFEIMIDEFI